MSRRRCWLLALLPLLLTIGGGSQEPGAAARPPVVTAELPRPRAGERILVVAPHPDDETLGCGGLLQQARAEGAELHVALMTNGDDSELAVLFGEHELPRRPRAFLDLGRRRQQESVAALAQLGVARNRVHFLGYPNDGLLGLWRPEHWPPGHAYRSPQTEVTASPYEGLVTSRASYVGAQVLADLQKVLEEVRPEAVFVTHPQDVHPDHWSTAAFTRFALSTLTARGAAWAEHVRVYGYLIHWPGYPSPWGLRPSASLEPPAQLAGGRHWVRLPLSPGEERRKLAAIRLYHSQLPSFDRLLLAFERRNELFEELVAAPIAAGGTVLWSSGGSADRGLGGAEMRRLRLRLEPKTVVVDIDTQPAAIPRDGYLAFDLRAWSPREGARIATAYLGPKSTWGVGLEKGRLRALQPARRTVRRGALQVVGLPRPVGSEPASRLYVTCWGSRADRITEAAVNTPLR